MYCPRCGQRNPEDSAFCSKCGTGLTKSSESTTKSTERAHNKGSGTEAKQAFAQAETGPSTANAEQQMSFGDTILGCGCLVVILILLVAAGIGVTSWVRSHGNARQISNAGVYRHKAVASVSEAAKIIGGFPSDEDEDNFRSGVDHVLKLHHRAGDFTIYQVVMEGRALREQRDAVQAAASAVAERANDIRWHDELAREHAIAAQASADEVHFIRADFGCLVYDDRSLEVTADEIFRYATGRIQNTCEREVGYVQVTITFYKPDGSLQNSSSPSVNDLGGGQTWSFKTIIPGDNDVMPKVSDVTGF